MYVTNYISDTIPKKRKGIPNQSKRPSKNKKEMTLHKNLLP